MFIRCSLTIFHINNSRTIRGSKEATVELHLNPKSGAADLLRKHGGGFDTELVTANRFAFFFFHVDSNCFGIRNGTGGAFHHLGRQDPGRPYYT